MRKMASCTFDLHGMPLNNADEMETWLRALAAKERTKKLSDDLHVDVDSNRSNETTTNYKSDLFLSETRMDTIQQVTLMATPRILENVR